MENAWIGVVLNKGFDCPPCGLDFGDVVLLNRWAHSSWLFRTTPLGHESQKFTMRSNEIINKTTRQFNCTGKDNWNFVEVDKIPFICGTWDQLIADEPFTQKTAGPGRILAELFDNKTSVLNPQWSRAGKMMGKIFSVGFGVEDVEVGQYCILNPVRGIRYQDPPDYDKWYVSIHADYIEAVGNAEDFAKISEVNAVWPDK